MACSSIVLLFVVAFTICSADLGLADDQTVPQDPAAYPNQRPYYLRQGYECRGPKVYEIQNVQDVDQCKEACIQFDCAAINLFQLGEFQFVCEILSRVRGYRPAQGSACYIGA